MHPKPAAGIAAIAAVCVALLFGVAPAAAGTLPVVKISAPASQVLIPKVRAVNMNGTASSPLGIASVQYAIGDNNNPAGCTGQAIILNNVSWLQPNGTWGCKVRRFYATLGSPGATSTTWSATIPFSSTTTPALPSGDYSAYVSAFDPAGNKGQKITEFGYGPAPTSSSPGLLTLLMGRAQWAASDKSCNPVPSSGTATLAQVGSDLAAMTPARSATAVVVVGYTDYAQGNPTAPCVGGNLYASWDQLQSLQQNYGWTAVSETITHPVPFAGAPPGTVDYPTETCGSLTGAGGLFEHGFPEAGGLFAYPNNDYGATDPGATIQRTYSNQCFAFGRTYRGGRNVQSRMAAPWLQWSTSVQGGTCHKPAAPCASHSIGNQTGTIIYYQSPVELASLVNVAGDEWNVLQFYKFLVGAGSVPGPGGTTLSWDCTSSNWMYHYTFSGELYCYNDFLAVVKAIPANVVVTDPATVASRWGVTAPH